MNITIIGAGSIGGTLVRQLTALGHRVAVANASGPERLAGLAQETGALPVSIDALPGDADVVVLAVPPTAYPALRPMVDRLPAAAVLVDAGNYVPGLRDDAVAALDDGATEAGWSAQVLGRPVVKAFNTIAVASLRAGGRPPGADDRIAAPVSGDDDAAKQVVIGLLGELGFDGFDAGSLEDSWRQQPGTPVYTADLPLARARRAIEEARPRDTAPWRERMAARAAR